MKKCISLHYFLVSVFVFCGYGLYFWVLFQFCGLILYFYVCFRLGCIFPFWDLCFCFLVVFFCFGFPFCLICFCFGFVLSYFCCCCCCPVVFCFYRPPYIFGSPLHLNPTTGERFKTPLKISSQIPNRSGKKLSPLTWNFSNQIFLQGSF